MIRCLASQTSPNGSLLSPTGSLTVSSVLAIRDCYRMYRGQRLALAGSPASFLKWLVVFDGIADSIYLIPAELDHLSPGLLFGEKAVDWLVAEPSFAGCSELPRLPDAWPRVQTVPQSLEHPSGSEHASSSDPVTKLYLATSGTTGVSKFVAHTIEQLTRPANLKPSEVELRWGMLYDPARFAGIQVLLRALCCGETLLAPAPNWELPKKVDWLAGQDCNALSATPSLWRQILASPASHRLPLKQITLGGEICDAAILGALQTRYPNARVTQIYASTEAGVVFSVHDGLPGFPASWLESGTKDCQLRCSPEDTLEVNLTSTENEADWLDTGDIVEQVENRVFFRGRKSGLINVGGNKVYPEEVETVVALVEGVESVLVRARASSMMGSLIEALVVPTAEATPNLVDRVRSRCKNVLPRFKQPAFIKVVAELPMNANGKWIRMELK